VALQPFPIPGLVLLDLNMPILTGFHVLEWLQRHPTSKAVVIVLTASSNPTDIEKVMSLGTAEYRVKPINSAHLVPILRELQARWLTSRPGSRPGGDCATRCSQRVAPTVSAVIRAGTRASVLGQRVLDPPTQAFPDRRFDGFDSRQSPQPLISARFAVWPVSRRE
jgi:DNA-binding response OmpR family regulator